jgi:type IV pilus assembly protein PilB
MRKRKLGEILRERGQISPADLAKAIEEQQGKVIHLGELLLQRRLVNKSDLIAALTEITRVPYVDCSKVRVESEALHLIPQPVAQRCCALPLACEGTRLVVALAEPQNLHTIDELRFTADADISPRLGFRGEIQTAILKWYSGGASGDLVEERAAPAEEEPTAEMEFVSSGVRQSNIEAIEEMQAELLQKRTPAVRLVCELITTANAKRASDIHIEPQATDTAVRIRVDGMLRDLQRVQRSLQNSLVSRIKILADMDIAERRAPQDGRFLVKMGERKIDLRVSTLPTQYGEKVVMRLLESESPLLSLAELGLSQEVEDALRRTLAQPQGLLLVTGPTGSGKSTTLYAALNLLRKSAVNIVTVEDPVEYVLQGVNQVQVNSKTGLTFANGLRSILRQDPNVIMVGEIRDKETAEIAMKASQTGHLVLSTLHTNDSIAAFTRLLDLGVPAYLIAASLSGIMAQRLVRKLCACHDQIPVTPEYVSQLLEVGVIEPVRTQLVPVGCAECDYTGYRGRVGIYELLVFDEAIRGALRTAGRTDEIRNLAHGNGMRFMQEYALEYLQRGLTTLDELLRVVPMENVASTPCPRCSRELAPTFLFCPYCGVGRTQIGRSQHGAPSGGVPQGVVPA